MLRCIDLALEVPGRVLCRALTASFEPGQSWAVLGRNGTGKTTLVHALAGLEAPAGGRIELDDVVLEACRPRERARRVSVLLQIEPGAYWGSVLDYVRLGRYPHAVRLGGPSGEDDVIARAALEGVGMDGFAERAYASLSGGERQRVRIAQLFAQDAPLMLLDEPLQHLDLAHQARVLKLIDARVRERRQTVLMVLHEPLWLGRCCSHALVFGGDGTAIAGRAEDVLTLERLELAYGCKLREIGGAERCFVPDV
jgi:iron complex transport system ATP-binding protein